MAAIFADLVVPDLDPFDAAERYPADALRAALDGLGELAHDLGQGDVWAQAVAFGTDAGPTDVRSSGTVGVSMAFACLAGIGFWRDHYLHTAVAEADREQARGPDPLRSEIARRRIAAAEVEARIRGPEVDAIRRVVEAAAGRLPFPLRAALDVTGTWAYDFDEAYRRRLAYALAFEASITAGSLCPYTDRLQPLIAGGLDELARTVPAPDDRGAFSIYLNLTRILDGALAHEAAAGGPHPDLAGAVREGAAKRQFLADQLGAAADARQRGLHSDGRIAVRALLDEIAIVGSQSMGSISIPPLFGRLAGSAAYQAPAA